MSKGQTGIYVAPIVIRPNKDRKDKPKEKEKK